MATSATTTTFPLKHHAPVTRLPEDVLGNIASCLTGANAVNFGLVCKAWAKAAQPAIWASMTIELARHYGETPFVIPAEICVNVDVYTRNRVARTTRLAHAIRLREKCEMALASLYAQPSRCRLVRHLAVDSRTGQFATAILLAVRDTLESLRIQLCKDRVDRDPDDPQEDDGEDATHNERLHILGMNIWDTFEGLWSSGVFFINLYCVHLELDESVTGDGLENLLRLCPGLYALVLDIRPSCDLEELNFYAPNESILDLFISCPVYPDASLHPLAHEIVSVCPNIVSLSIDHDFGVKVWEDWFESVYDGPYPDHEVRDDDFFKALANLSDLSVLRWQARPYACFTEWAKREGIEVLGGVCEMMFQLPVASYLSLGFGSFEPFVPALPELLALTFEGVASQIDHPIIPDPSKRAIKTIPDEAIRCFDSAPKLRFIVFRDTSLPSERSGIERLFITTVRRAGTKEPLLYITRHNRIRSGPSTGLATLKDPRTHTATYFQGKPINEKVLRRMAELHGVDMLEGREVEVAEEVWAELEPVHTATPQVEEGRV